MLKAGLLSCKIFFTGYERRAIGPNTVWRRVFTVGMFTERVPPVASVASVRRRTLQRIGGYGGSF